MTGWNMPPGCNVSDIPGCGPEAPCEVCGKFVDDCLCPECPSCGAYGDPACYAPGLHGLVRSAEQVASFAEYERREQEWAATQRYDDEENQ